MSRIDVKTLVLAFENRISALEKNPPDKISTGVVINLLEKALEEEIRNHFLHLVKLDIEAMLKSEYELMRTQFTKKVIENILIDEEFRSRLEDKLKSKVMRALNELG